MDIIKEIENLNLKIWNPTLKKETEFILSDGQKEVLKSIETRNTLVKQTRQVGMTYCLLLYLLEYASSKERHHCLYFASSNDGAESAIEKMKYIGDCLSDKQDFPKIKFSKNLMKFENGSTIRFVSNDTDYDSIIGASYDVTIFDNAVFYIDNLFEKGLPSITIDGKIIVCSCPQYKKGAFYTLWNNPHAPYIKLSIDSSKTYWQGADYPNKMRQFFEKEDSFKMEMLGEFVNIPQE